MLRHVSGALLCIAILAVIGQSAQAQQAYGQQWGHSYTTQDWNKFYHYPYVYYPQNFYGPDYYRSSDDMYHRYPAEMQIPVYNKSWENFYPQHRRDPVFSENLIFPFGPERNTGVRYHKGHHYILDVF